MTPKAAVTVLAGPAGAGKTTLVRLIPGLVEGDHGQLLVDGVPVTDFPLSPLRQAIGYVSQTPFLFSRTVAGNVAYGVEEAGAEEVLWAAERATDGCGAGEGLGG